MKLNNKGFALTSIIYMLIVLFLLTMLLVLANLATRKVVLDKIKNDVKYNLNQGGLVAQNIYIVTFDPTLGQIDQTSKQVKYNEPYGELPTPTREGYKFMGWRSKNLLNMQAWLDSFKNAYNGNITKDENSITLTATGNDAYTNSRNYNILVSPNTTYTLSWESTDTSVSGYVYVFINNQTTSGYMFAVNDNNTQSLTFTTPSDARYINFRIGVESSGNSKTYSNIQLEEGNIATTYELYHEKYTNETVVKNRSNHTLYATWDSIYNIVYNGNGETSGATESSVHIYNEYKNLTPNGFEKMGYYFTGWSTSSSDINIIHDNNERSYDNTSGSNIKDLKRYTIQGPFKEGDVYQLDVDVRGSGEIVTYFYGENGYLQVANSLNSNGTYEYFGDGHNSATLSNEYTHYYVRFTLGSNGDGSIDKYLLFRLFPGNSAYIKNIRFYKVSSTSHAYVDEQSVKNLSEIPNDTINLYAIWKANE